MSLLNALELLLSRCERWEPFAHRHVSLKAEMAQLRSRIVFLRHQQLQDWRDLRNFREETRAKEAYVWTPDLVLFLREIIVDNANNSLQDEISKSHCQKVWSYLEMNTLSKSIGQFESRLHVIEVVSQMFQVGLQ